LAIVGSLETLLVRQYPASRIILVLDNAAYHKSAAALAILSLFEEPVGVVWLPPYCSELNAIERLWGDIKDQVCANRLEDRGSHRGGLGHCGESYVLPK
ncbi:MAG: transposase, partial [Anaerolineaceae bacterium]|nr:transposase [Anaerolineaceae bacterium]